MSIQLKPPGDNEHHAHDENLVHKETLVTKVFSHIPSILIAEVIVTIALTVASWFSLSWIKWDSQEDKNVLIVSILSAIFSYLLLLVGSKFRHRELAISKKPITHIILLSIFFFCATLPTGYTIWTKFHNRRQPIISLIGDCNGLLKAVYLKDSLSENDRKDILSFCVRSIVNNRNVFTTLRATVVYRKVDTSKNTDELIMPANGYVGDGANGFTTKINALKFDISDRKPDESDEQFKRRIGVAGYAFRYLDDANDCINDEDVQASSPDKKYIYKRFDASEKDMADHAMLCVIIRRFNSLTNKEEKIGVLTISSMEVEHFSEDERRIALFFANLLSKQK